jgi:hypothetical protein
MSPDALAALPPQYRLIVAAGAIRSGSTALFNMLRLLLEHSGTPLTAGWVDDVKEPLKTTLLVKIHEWHPMLSKRANVVLTCHRDLRYVVRSLGAMKWLDTSPAVQVAHIVQNHAEWARIATLDLRYEDMTANLNQAVRRVAAALGYKDRGVDLDTITREVEALPSSTRSDQKYDATTLMHKSHRRDGYGEPLSQIETEIHHRFAAWQAAHGYT